MNEEKLEIVRHSLAHVMAAAVKELYPEAKFGVGPAVEDGFYYDIDFGEARIGDAELKKIQGGMKKIIGRKLDFVRSEKTLDEALEWARENGQDYKVELIEDLKKYGTTVETDIEKMNAPKKDEILKQVQDDKNSKATFYTVGDFTDLCRGPHVRNTSEIPVDGFKLTRVAGAYWRGDEKNKQLTRIYGVAFADKTGLDEYLARVEEAKKRDHRKIGKEMDLFTFSDLVGAGLPMFTPRGTILRDKLAELSTELREAHGFRKVWTPHITKTDLYKVSGHLAKFGEGFRVEGQVSGERFMMKPMNCPHHTQIFASSPKTYRDMPVRYMEVTTDYRDEKTGELGGLNRVRSLTQDDSHVFCRESQIEDEIANLIDCIKKLYDVVGMSSLRARLSYRDDSDSYLGDKKLWARAQDEIKKVAIENKLDYFEQAGEAAFYGPKIDFMAKDAIGREHQVATIQLDFVMPGRFGLSFTNEKGEKETPVMIHHATLGSIERFMSVFIEHTAGKFPVWCAPEQLRLILVQNDNPKLTKFAENIREKSENVKIRMTIDDSNNSVGKKIRSVEKDKVPYSVVLGEKEMASGKLPLRVRADLGENTEISVDELIARIADKDKNRTR